MHVIGPIASVGLNMAATLRRRKGCELGYKTNDLGDCKI